MIARGKREAKQARRPWLTTQKKDRGLKGRNNIPPFQGCRAFFISDPGATRFALAPGCYIPRRWRSVSNSEEHCIETEVSAFANG